MTSVFGIQNMSTGTEGREYGLSQGLRLADTIGIPALNGDPDQFKGLDGFAFSDPNWENHNPQADKAAQDRHAQDMQAYAAEIKAMQNYIQEHDLLRGITLTGVEQKDGLYSDDPNTFMRTYTTDAGISIEEKYITTQGNLPTIVYDVVDSTGKGILRVSSDDPFASDNKRQDNKLGDGAFTVSEFKNENGGSTTTSTEQKLDGTKLNTYVHTRKADGSYTLKHSDGSRTEFDKDGKQIGKYDANGNPIK